MFVCKTALEQLQPNGPRLRYSSINRWLLTLNNQQVHIDIYKFIVL